MQDLSLKSLRMLVAVCDKQSIKEAAIHEHIEPSAISKRLAQLEESLGTPILVRGRHGTKATPAGHALLEHARAMLVTADRIEADMAAFKGGIKGQVRIAASASAIAESLLDDLSTFMRNPLHHDIQMNIEERYSHDIVSQVRDGMVSLGICWSNIDMAGLEFTPYRQDELVLAVPTLHALASCDAIHFEDTLTYEHVGLPPSTAVYSMLHRAASKSGHKLSYRIIVSNFDAAFRVVGAGLGISVVPRQVSEMYARDGKIKTVALLNDWAPRQFVICYRNRKELTPAAERLLNYLGQQIAPAS